MKFHEEEKLFFASDYMEGAHPAIMQRLAETNMLHTPGYGQDVFSESARQKIRKACQAPDADVFFLVGGTQTNATVLDAMLKSYQGVIAAKSGHVSVHEAGAIEYGGHKVLALPHRDGKISAQDVENAICAFWEDQNHDHMVMPGMVYISQPSEYGTIYSLEELESLSQVCRANHVALYLDGARLAYALACPENDVTLADIARLCDAFYIGGTKCGALFGEAIVFPRKDTIPHFFTIVKQHGALLAKSRLAGVQFDALFTDGLYFSIARHAIDMAMRLRQLFTGAGIPVKDSPTNQQFVVLTTRQMEKLRQHVLFETWEPIDDERTLCRFVTSWATTDADISALQTALASL